MPNRMSADYYSAGSRKKAIFCSGTRTKRSTNEIPLSSLNVFALFFYFFKFNFKLGLLYCLLFLLGIVLEHASERELACVELVDGILRICN